MYPVCNRLQLEIVSYCRGRGDERAKQDYSLSGFISVGFPLESRLFSGASWIYLYLHGQTSLMLIQS